MSDQHPSSWEDAELTPACLAWVKAVDRLMLAAFCIDLSDAGADGDQIIRYWQGGQAPDDFVDWFGEKYDLITRDQWDPFGVARRAIRP